MFFLKALFVRLQEWIAPCVSLWALWHLAVGQWLWLAPFLAWAPMWLINQWRVRKANVAFLDDREMLSLTPALAGVGLVLISGERNLLLWWTLAGLFVLLLNTVVMSKLSRGVREQSGESRDLSSMTFRNDRGEAVLANDARLLMFVHSGWNPHSVMQLRDLEAFLTANTSVAPNCVALIFADQIPTHLQSITQLKALGVNIWCDDGDNAIKLGLWLRGASVLRKGVRNALRPAMAILQPEASAPLLWLVASTDRLPPSASQHQARILALLDI